MLRNLSDDGIKRLDWQWGFDDKALMTVARVIAPSPRKLPAAIFDQPMFDKTSLIALPDGVDSFVDLSMDPAEFVEAMSQFGPAEGLKAQVEELAEVIRSTGKVDIQKDLLSQFGPRMAIYLAPGRSAVATGDESMESLFSQELSSMAAFSAIQSVLPKLTVVAEVKNPVAFRKALDTAIVAINSEFKTQAIELATQADAAKGEAGAAGAGRNPNTKTTAAAARARRRRLQETPYPKFTLAAKPSDSPGESTAAPETEVSYVLITPHDSPIRFGPAGFRPTLRLDGKIVAFSLAQDSAAAATAALKVKNWKPSAQIEKACEHVPAKLVLLIVNDVAETIPTFLASLPGTLQTAINTSIAMAGNQGGGQPAAGGSANQPGAAMAMAGRGMGDPRGMMGDPRGMMGDPRGGRGGGPRGAGREGAGGPGPGGPAVGASGAFGAGGPRGAGGGFPGGPPRGPGNRSGSPVDPMVQFQIDPDKLPKADDLKTHLFASTLSVTNSEQEIKFLSRGAFPNVNLPMVMGSIHLLVPALNAWAAKAEQEAQAAAASAAASEQPPSAAVPGGPGQGRPPGAGAPGAGLPGGRRGRRGPD